MNVKSKSLFCYILPALGGMFVTYLYNVVDGIFVGRGVGSAALGAVNIAVPFITFVVAITAMFPMGGATVVAIRMGRGDKKGANHAFMTALALTLIVSIFLTIIGMTFSQEIVDFSGANKLSAEMREMANQYLFYCCGFSTPMLLSTCLSIFVRNDGSPTLSFVGMCVGATSNIFLDWLFIFPLQMGLVGAAIASGFGQILAVLVLLSHFILKKGDLRIKGFNIDFSLIQKICKRGVPESITQLTTPVTAFCYNLMLAQLIGDIGISTFSILSFIFSLANAILSGVAQGLQPLWGQCYGKKSVTDINWYFRRGIIINLILAITIYIVLSLYDIPIIRIFNQENELVNNAAVALPVFAISFIPMALNLIFTANFFSTKRTTEANIIAISRGIVIKSLAIFLMPCLFGPKSIWLAPLVAEVSTLLIAFYINRKKPVIFK